MNRKKPVQFSEEKDISLLRHVLGENPFEQTKRWADIALAMTDDSFLVDARRVRERTQLLIAKFKREDAKNIRKSGEEEDLTEKTVLLQECLDLQREAETVLQKERDAKEDQKSKDEETGKNIRKRALEGLMKNETTRKAPKMSPLDFLKMKTEAEKDIKEKEMELKKRELSLQEQRFELEREERRAAIELQKRQSDAMLKLIEKMN